VDPRGLFLHPLVGVHAGRSEHRSTDRSNDRATQYAETRGIQSAANRFMQGPGSTSSNADHVDESEHAPLTPRGMAAPPPARSPRRADGNPGRPATIRIEANVRAPLPGRRESELERAAARPNPTKTVALNERLQGLVLSQGLLLNAFVLLLVFGWTAPLPGRRYLLGAFAIGGIAIALLIHLALRAGQARRSNDNAPPTGATTSFDVWFARVAVRALPAALVGGWIALGIYALALPPAANA
jgi:hypothetical protein